MPAIEEFREFDMDDDDLAEAAVEAAADVEKLSSDFEEMDLNDKGKIWTVLTATYA
jgi:hypothetical protein